MTPKEKAQELVKKYKPFAYCYLGSGMLINQENEYVILSNAKKCALIAVDEMIEAFSRHQNVIAWKEYMEVKQEIEKL